MMTARGIWIAALTVAAFMLSACTPTTGLTSAVPAPAIIRPATIKPASVMVNFTVDGIDPVMVEGDAGVAGRPVTVDDPARVATVDVK